MIQFWILDFRFWIFLSNDRRTKLYPSRTSKTDLDLVSINDHRDQLFSTGDLSHLVQKILALNDIPVVDVSPITFKGLTGLNSVGSTEFSVNDDSAHKDLRDSIGGEE